MAVDSIMKKKKNVSITVIRRLPEYHRYLTELLEKEVGRVSSQELSELTGFTASQIRQDLNNFGGFGQQGYGYNVEELHSEIGKILGLDEKHRVVVTGAGNLGHAIAYYGGFRDAGFDIIGLFGENIDDPRFKDSSLEIKHPDRLAEFIKDNDINVGVITTSKEKAQETADTYVEAGIRAIWNFAPVDLELPEDISVETVRLTESLFTLSYFLKENKADK